MEKCKKCGNDMVLDDIDIFRGTTTKWYICPRCGCSIIVEINLKTKEVSKKSYDFNENEVEE